MNITLLAVGSIKKSWINEGCRDYVERLQHECSFHVIEVPASKEKDPPKQAAEESQKILDRLGTMKGKIWVLDEQGKDMPSMQLSAAIEKVTDRGDSLIIVLGGAYGLSDAVRGRADTVITLSAMTLPHELCRIVILEQLYRALQICKGTGYHHASVY